MSNSNVGAVSAFHDAVDAQMQKPGFRGDRRDAIARVCKSQPELHRAFLLATNASTSARASIADRFAAEAEKRR